MRGNRNDSGQLDGLSQQEMARDVLDRFQEIGSRFWGWVAVLGILTLLGVVGFLIRVADGFDDRPAWGYYTATLIFLMTTFVAAPIVSAGLRLIKGHWRRSMTRAAELHGLAGMLGLLMLFPALAALPALQGRNNIWFDWPQFVPMGWDSIAVMSLAVCGVAFLWALVLPDLAAARDHLPSSGRQRVIRWLALGWQGESRQWRVQRMGVLTLGGFYMLLFVIVQVLLASDLAAGLLPGWKDPIFPTHQILGGIQGAAAITLVTMLILRSAGGYRRYLGEDQFWGLSKPLLALSLLWFYFWWSSFIVLWFGRQPTELGLLRFMMFETYRFPFLMAFFLNFMVPLLALMWNPVRRSVWGPALVAVGILVGTFFNHVRTYVAAFSVEDPTAHVLDTLPAAQMPQAPDILIIIGAISGAALLFLLVSKLVPVISLWEVGEGLRVSRVRRFLGREVRVIGKAN